jgi:RHS repeat-associated protein
VTETYTYDGDGARVTRTRSGVTTTYLAGLWEETSNGTIQQYYLLDGVVVAMRTTDGGSSTLAYGHGDHLGSVSLNTSAGTALLAQQEYDPWGRIRLTWGQTGIPIQQTDRTYTGQYLDETGLLFYNARYYDPAIGRFVSADTIVPGNAAGGSRRCCSNSAIRASATASCSCNWATKVRSSAFSARRRMTSSLSVIAASIPPRRGSVSFY